MDTQFFTGRTDRMTNRLAGLATGAAILGAVLALSGCASTPDAPPSPTPPHMIVGGPCTYSTQTGALLVVAVDPATSQGSTAHFKFTPDGQSQPDAVSLEALFASNPPSVGQTISGQHKTETHGTCDPQIYLAIINGSPVTLSAAH